MPLSTFLSYCDIEDEIYDRIPMGKGNHVDFYEQYVKQVISFSSQYGSNYSISYAAANIIGPPIKFPKYGDFSQTFAMRTYGPWWDKAPSRLIDYMPQNNMDIVSQDYIDILFHKDVYPIRVSIYEVYNPGSVVRIWAQGYKLKWHLLWSGSPQKVPSTSRIFSPPLRTCNFKTNFLRIEFNHSSSDYYTEVDTVILIGTSELILPKDQSHQRNISNLLKSINSKYLCREDIHNLTPNYEDVHSDIRHLKKMLNEHCIMYKSDVVANFHKSKLISQLGPLSYYVPPPKGGSNSMQHFLTEELTNFMEEKFSSDKSKKPARCGFSTLPDEIIIKILKNLDLKSLCRLSRVNKYFNNLAQDPMLYTRLNLKPYWYIINTEALNYLAFRCKYLQQLDISWCSNLSVYDFEKFLDTCDLCLLTHLRLNCCVYINDFAMLKISMICKNLKELGLRNCELITDKGFSCLENLEFLERLDLYRTHIKTQTLCKILRENRRMRHLHLGNTDKSLNVDDIAIELRNSCPDLETIDFWKARTLTSQGIDALAHCKNLREVDFGWCGSTTGHGDSFRRLLSSCEHLEKIFLASFRELTERDLRALTMCRNLKQIDLLGTLSLTNEICYAFFVNCPKLEFIDVSFCNNVTNCSIQRWRQIYKHVMIKRIKYT